MISPIKRLLERPKLTIFAYIAYDEASNNINCDGIKSVVSRDWKNLLSLDIGQFRTIQCTTSYKLQQF